MKALILHGWPQYDIKEHFLVKYLEENGYECITPNMFINDNPFSSDNILSEVKRLIGNTKLDLIVGISLGGLIAPHIAKEYPNSKLIFIASGKSIDSKSKTFNTLLSISKSKFGRTLLPTTQKLPTSIMSFIYRLVTPYTGVTEGKKDYELDMLSNIESIKRIPIYKEIEIIDSIARMDNTEILKNIGNKTLIFSGMNDILMSKESGIELKKLVDDSTIHITEGSHFNSFTENNLVQVREFISDN
jgi:esterase/lipase